MFWNSLCLPSWPWTYWDLSPTASQVLELKVCVTISWPLVNLALPLIFRKDLFIKIQTIYHYRGRETFSTGSISMLRDHHSQHDPVTGFRDFINHMSSLRILDSADNLEFFLFSPRTFFLWAYLPPCRWTMQIPYLHLVPLWTPDPEYLLWCG